MANSTENARVWDVLTGRARIFGLAPARATKTLPCGLIRPSLLKSAVGLGYQDSDDEHFIENANRREKLALLSRYLFCSLFGLLGDGNKGPEHRSLFGVRFSALSMRDAVSRIEGFCDAPRDDAMRTVAFVNADCLNKAYADREYHFLLGQCDLVLPDGSGLRLAGKLLGWSLPDNVNGTDLFPLLCAAARDRNLRVFLVGGKPGVAAEAANTICQRLPGLQVVGTSNGFDDMRDSDRLINKINASSADILLLGLGAPAQERWLQENASSLNARVGLGVGGLFDYFSGNIARAPIWLREMGLEWIWRIMQEPSAKWRRYLIGNPLFLLRVLKERRRQHSPDNSPSLMLPREAVAASASKRAPSIQTFKWRQRIALHAAFKRTLDIAVSACGLLVLSPLLLATVAAIRLESKGPVFFAQVRVGKRGRLFKMYKFRSMHVDSEQSLKDIQAKNESADGVIFKMKRDPRITRVGSVIRRLSIDELPQILNILKGDMSVVGPRPALPSEVAQYTAQQRKRLQCRPGLTCLWQVGGRSDLSFSQQVELDLQYLSRQSIGNDIQIIAKTVPAVFGGKGAY